MRGKTLLAVVGTLGCLPFTQVLAQSPLGPAFTYQGQLQKGGVPLSTPADLRFTLWNTEVGGSQVGPIVTVDNVTVDYGLFTVELDFGASAFNGEARWLEIAVRAPAGGGNFVTLSPRQRVAATPYALYGLDTEKIRGRLISTAAPSAGQVLKWNGSAWAPATDNDTTYTPGTGLTLAGTQFSLDLTYVDGRYVNEGQNAGGDLTGTYPNPTIAANAVASAEITDGSVSSADIATNAITSLHIADNAVGASEIAADAVGSSEIAANAVYSGEIADGSIQTADLGNGSVTFSKLSNTLDIGANIWHWAMTTGWADITVTSNGPAVRITNNGASEYADGLYVESTSTTASRDTWALYVSTEKGHAGLFEKYTADGKYAVRVDSMQSNGKGLYVYGTIVSTGANSAVIQTSAGPQAIFSVESPEVEVYASGNACLASGRAYVAFDRLFTEAVSADVEIRVTLTPIGGWGGLYLESTSPEGFAVASAAGDPNVCFHWMACGRRLGYESRPEITIPDPAEEEAIRHARKAAHAAKRAQAQESSKL